MNLAFKLLDEPDRTHTHTLDSLCDHLTQTVVVPFLERQGLRWDLRFEQFFLHDRTSDPFAPTGTIVFYPPPLFLGQLSQLESAIQRELDARGIRYDPFARQYYSDGVTVKAVHVPIHDNPTAPSGPPEVSMSGNSGRLVLRDVLDFEPVAGRFQFTADELLSRVERVTEERIRHRSSSPLCHKDGALPREIRPTPSVVTIRRIHRCLGELRAFGEWARAHHYQRIEAAPLPQA